MDAKFRQWLDTIEVGYYKKFNLPEADAERMANLLDEALVAWPLWGLEYSAQTSDEGKVLITVRLIDLRALLDMSEHFSAALLKQMRPELAPRNPTQYKYKHPHYQPAGREMEAGVYKNTKKTTKKR